MHAYRFLLFCCWYLIALCGANESAAQVLPRAKGSDFRMLVWNVSREQLFEQRLGYEASLRAIDADLLIFDEMSAERDSDDVRELLQQVYGDTEQWQVAYGSSGYKQRVVFALRGAIEPLPAFNYLPYPPRFARAMRDLRLAAREREQMSASLDGGIGAFAVWAQLGGKRLLLAGVDLQCCGDSDDAWEERRRYVESRAIRRVLEQSWRARRPDALIVAGDFNAVRGRKPVALMQGRRGSALRLSVVEARHANGQDAWTWDGRGTPFPSRPIDFVLHSAALRVLQSLVFDPETMSDTQRRALGLSAQHMLALSSHRPVVVDFAWR